ncbi:uncharacterized protein N7477_000635 [Penicillium maclennaniae]|uniref:uncharacterized protein n=1 Tax=Penicillium maclennaniae TaxID=1343394 RepID=UPI0025410D0D|nr:uncharacterized protein N7477_000635 [Penicillium maclennaniae]KAJ5684290.1 hypothetical protein N7477_000635 [Penicillium maclennaniae]
MSSPSHSVFFPTEIVFLVAEFLDHIDEDDSSQDSLSTRQRAFYNFCLVSAQWYSVGVSFLYQRPYFPGGNGFTKFAHTLCPPRGVKRKANFGSMVKVLSLASLVHHSMNSLTARLLGQMKENLEVFIAPRVSFSVNSLPALSKCQNLLELNLSLVSGHVIPFHRLKKAISSLPKLRKLELPASMSLTHTDKSAGSWPPKLRSLKIGGTLDPRCTNLTAVVLYSVLENEQLRERLESLDLDNTNEEMCSDQASDSLYWLPKLIYLKIPVDVTKDLLLLPPPEGLPSLPLRALELTRPYFAEEPLGFDLPNEMLKAFKQNLPNLWAFGISEKCVHLVKEREEELDDEIWNHIDEADDDELEKLEDLGLYILDDNL